MAPPIFFLRGFWNNLERKLSKMRIKTLNKLLIIIILLELLIELASIIKDAIFFIR